ncbi:inosine-uridine nucleoside N-ribohydrolase [Actinoplanes sp. NBRC 14428]|uniref:Purine nucleosidase n=1 Tax=Pseudosporangium ferrugineum TaxID=439699 RepID=A0A2T0SI39_9ACTN|nr:nucleoside hydrolase [Pseudosporangium ferrugineum]PRY33085.1 purine nucleosidase [Pseudosporangium ferrugineum]BCJ48933.1 inosine-uridine nucleoside N-ribohydrolase [Actinoplanes sp. NBRC 14428]
MADPVYLDCDTGVDDALALALLLGSADLLGAGTVSGNTGAEQAARNTLDLLALGGRADVPVATGARHSLTGTFRGAGVVHGGNGVGGVRLPRSAAEPVPVAAADLLIALARARPGTLRVLATGPLTNLAVALRREPGLPRLVRDVTVMGGAVRVPGNVTGHGEANIADDPEAAAEVLAAGWPVTLVPLDVTMRHCFGPADQDALRAHGTPLAAALADVLTAYLDYYEPVLGERRMPLHDPLAAAVLTGAVTPAEAPELGLRVGLTDRRGGLTEDPDAPRRTRVVLSLTEPAAPVLRDLILAGT